MSTFNPNAVNIAKAQASANVQVAQANANAQTQVAQINANAMQNLAMIKTGTGVLGSGSGTGLLSSLFG